MQCAICTCANQVFSVAVTFLFACCFGPLNPGSNKSIAAKMLPESPIKAL